MALVEVSFAFRNNELGMVSTSTSDVFGGVDKMSNAALVCWNGVIRVVSFFGDTQIEMANVDNKPMRMSVISRDMENCTCLLHQNKELDILVQANLRTK